jgi:hypothetical protein
MDALAEDLSLPAERFALSLGTGNGRIVSDLAGWWDPAVACAAACKEMGDA